MGLRDFAYDAIGPLAGPPLILAAVVTPLAALAQTAGLFGAPLLAILAGWVWSYAFLIAEALAEGHEVPVLSIERTNPWHDPRALVPPLLVLALGWIATGSSGGAQVLATIVAAAIAILLPASVALLAVGCELHQALWPPALLRIVAGLGTRYLGVLLVGGAYAAGVALVGPRSPSVVTIALGQLALYSFGALLGRSLYRRRDELGLDSMAAPERQETHLAGALAGREADAIATEIYGLLRARRTDEAWRIALGWLDRWPDDASAGRFLRQRALDWGELRFADRIDGAALPGLVRLRLLGEAVAIVEACWSRGGTLASQSAPVRAALVAAARRMGHDATAERLAGEPVQDAARD